MLCIANADVKQRHRIMKLLPEEMMLSSAIMCGRLLANFSRRELKKPPCRKRGEAVVFILITSSRGMTLSGEKTVNVRILPLSLWTVVLIHGAVLPEHCHTVALLGRSNPAFSASHRWSSQNHPAMDIHRRHHLFRWY